MTTPDLHDPDGLTRWVTSPVRISDTDLVGHVNNVAMAAHVEAGRVAYISHVSSQVRDGGGLVLRRLEIDFLGEVFYPAELRIGSRLLGLGRTSFTVGTGVFDGGRCVATATGVLVLVGEDGPAPLSPAARTALEAELPD